MVRLVKDENDLATVNPMLAKEWHPTKNENLNPEDITSGSSKEVWWLCPKGHSYSMVVNQRTKRGYEDDLRVKSARLVELDTLLNLDGRGRSQPESVIAKSARPSVLDSLKRPVPPRSPEKKPKQHEEVR